LNKKQINEITNCLKIAVGTLNISSGFITHFAFNISCIWDAYSKPYRNIKDRNKKEQLPKKGKLEKVGETGKK